MTHDLLNRLKRRYAPGCKLLSNQKDREFLSVAAFLEIAGVGFKAVQFEPCQTEPPDVIFRPIVSSKHQQEDCAFEVTELLDKDTKRNHEIYESFKTVECAITQDHTYENYVTQSNIVLEPKRAIAFAELFEFIQERITAKYIHYQKNKIKTEDIDLLVNIQLKNLFMKPDEKIYSPDTPLIKEWRSISFLMESCCGVIYLSKHAPQVLRDIHRRGLIYVNNRPEIWDEMIQKLGLPY
jgi:hypothetical protein